MTVGQPDPGVDVLVLGPVGLQRGDDFVSPPSGVFRAVLAALALAGPAGLSSSELFNAVWGSRAASAERSTITVTIHRIRQWLQETVGDAVRIERSSSGYVLSADSDVAQFRRLAVSGRYAEALALWRGRALADVPADSQDPVAIAALVRDRLDAAYSYAKAFDDPAAVVRALAPLVEEHPLDEPLQAYWMQALASTGRQADALDAYERVRHRLRTELGVDPGAALTECLVKILRSEIPTRQPSVQRSTVTPTQLPAAVAAFTGRTEQLATLDSLRTNVSKDVSPVVVVCGPGGVGKTSLTVQWARTAIKDFPDGQLFVDLRGYSRETPVPAVEALHRFIRALGCAADEIPADRDESSALYRSLLTDRRMLIVLDNALSADQVRPLLPGSASCTIAITSRDRLEGLAARDGALRLDLGILPEAEASLLLQRAIGQDRIGEEQSRVGELALRCGYLPLALRIAGAQLRTGPGMSIAAYLQQMSEVGALTTLAIEGDGQATVSVAFDLSYFRLPQEAKRLYRLLSLVPGPDVPIEALSELASVRGPALRRHLRILVSANLVNEDLAERFSLHDIVKSHAHMLLIASESAKEQEEASRRLFCWYLSRTDAACDLLYEMTRPPRPASLISESALSFESQRSAARWLHSELPNMMSLIRAESFLEMPHTWMLVDALRGYFAYRRLVSEWREACQVGLSVASRDQDLVGQAAMHLNFGGFWLFGVRDLRSATAEFRLAEEFAERGGWKDGIATTLLSQALAEEEAGDLRSTVPKLARVIRFARSANHYGREAVARNNLATSYINQGRLRQAVSQLCWALDHRFGREGNPTAALLECRGDALRHLGRFLQSREDLIKSVTVSRAADNRFQEMQSLATLALLYVDMGELSLATGGVEDGLRLAEIVQDRALEGSLRFALGRIYEQRKEKSEALRHYEFVCRRGGEGVKFSFYAGALLRIASVLSDVGAARHVLATVKGKGYLIIEGQAHALLAELAESHGLLDDAVETSTQAMAVFEKTDYRLGEVKVLAILERIHRRAVRESDADECARRAAEIFRNLGLDRSTAGPR